MKSFRCVKSLSFFFLVLFGLTFSFSSPVFAAEVVGQMIWVRGNVQAIDASNHARTLQRRSLVYEKDTIVTGAGSAQIVFTDNSVVALREGTVFRIDQYKFNPSSPGDSRYVAGIAKGGFRTITGLISKNNPEGYQVNTPVATIGVRGTDYSIYYTPSQGLSVKLDRGAIVVANSGGIAELNAAQNRVYAEIRGLRTAPVVTTQPAPAFRSQPSPVRAVMPPVTGGGAAGTGTTTGAPESTTYTVPSGGPTKQVSGFCIE